MTSKNQGCPIIWTEKERELYEQGRASAYAEFEQMIDECNAQSSNDAPMFDYDDTIILYVDIKELKAKLKSHKESK